MNRQTNKYTKRYIIALLLLILSISTVFAQPASVSNLKNITYAPNHINWTWNDPIGANFSYVTVYIDGIWRENVSKGDRHYNATGLIPNTQHKISTHTVDLDGNVNQTWRNHTAYTASEIIDDTPPASISNLKNITYASNYINWTWDDPDDEDFSHVMTYLNGTFKDNISKGIQHYNATGLIPNTQYKISTRTVDLDGNVNQTWRNKTATTASPDTVAPASVSDLKNITYASNYINWTWDDPDDEDFSHVMTYLNGTFKDNISKGIQHYNATDLVPNTTYKIGTRTVDLNGNINQTWKNKTATTARPDTTPPKSVNNLRNISYGEDYINWTWNDPDDEDFSYVMIYLDNTYQENVSKGIEYYNATDLNESTQYIIDTRTVDLDGNINQTWKNNSARTKNPKPKITVIKQPSNFDVIIGTSLYFNISANQRVNVTWKINDSVKKTEEILAGRNSNYTFSPDTKGTYNITVTINNKNGTDFRQWSTVVHPKTYLKGNRIWDGSKRDEYSLTYTWNPYSFAGFYYDINEDIGNESITISLDDYTDRTIDERDIVYSTSPQEVYFDHSEFGKYSVIGFMADKYFAGYTTRSKISNRERSTISSNQLHKILIDDDSKRAIYAGSTLTLSDGYTLKVKDVDIGAGPGQVWLTLLKDGNEVDHDTVAGKETYIYSKRVGSVDDLTIIAVYMDSVFRGREANAVFVKGVFQISDSYTSVKSGDSYGAMKIIETSENRIAMENKNSVSLSAGSIVDIMGNLKILVADSNTVRFALYSEKTPPFDARGTIYPATEGWTPMNFGLNIGKKSIGFYYDIDEGIGTEEIKILSAGSRSIPEDKLVYSTSPQEVSFDYSNFGKYNVIGFMADKYFAGYTTNNKISNNREISTIGSGQLHKVILDNEGKYSIYAGSTLTLGDGYILKVKEVDVGAGKGQAWLTLLKDGNEIDNDVIEAGDTYTYTKRVGSVSDLPIIAVHIDSVFRGREANAVFVKGIFQISDSYTSVKSGDNYGLMKISEASRDKIMMKNKNSISLSSGSVIELMGNIKFRVADDSTTLRFYPFVTVTSEMTVNRLIIDAPSTAKTGDIINIKVTAGGDLVEGVSITFDPYVGLIGRTDNKGILNYTISKELKGKYSIIAEKLNYIKANKSIDIQYVEKRLTIQAPSTANQFETITVKVIHDEIAINQAIVAYNNITIGTTNENGTLNFTLEVDGTHIISASKEGYVSVYREIEVIPPFSEFKALDINIIPDKIFTNEKTLIRSNITNIGTKADTKSIELMINDKIVDNKSINISPKETKEINFTYKASTEGNYTIQILEQKRLLEVEKKPFNIFYLAVIATIIGIVVIYIIVKYKTNI